MSFFTKMFGGKKEEAMTTGEAIQKLRGTEEMLTKKQEFLEKKITEEIDTAKKNAQKNKRGRHHYSQLENVKTEKKQVMGNTMSYICI